MTRHAHRRWPAGVLAAITGVAAALGLVLASTPRAATAPLSIAISGNHFVDGAGDTVRLLGVDQPSLEYACEQGWGEDDGMMDATDAAEIAAWHADAVRLPLNEDCWLGINGQPAYGTSAAYRQTVEDYVSTLEAAGVYVILDLHWTAPASAAADGQRPMPDAHSTAFWSSVAATFAGDHAVVFDAFNEPYSPAANSSSEPAVSWDCWESGGCEIPAAADGTTPDDGDEYAAVGMQSLVTAIRNAGATQPIMLGGLSYANDLSGWLSHEPSDPEHQLAASFHVYEGNRCDAAGCWDSEVAPVAAQVPVVAGEFGQDCDGSNFDDTWMDWADGHGVSYLAWAWWDIYSSCDDYTVLADASGTPAAPNGTALHGHLLTVAATTTTATTSSTTTTRSTTSTATSTTPTTPTTSTTEPAATSATTPTTATAPTAPTPAPGALARLGGRLALAADGSAVQQL